MIRRIGAAAFAATALLAACGGSTTATKAGATATTTVAAATPSASAAGAADATTTVAGAVSDRGAQLQAWRDCLSQHGVTLPTIAAGANPGQGRRNGGTGSTIAGAPAGSTPSDGAPPDGSGARGPGGFGGLGGFGTVLQDPANADAVAACASLQPQGGGGFGAGQGGQGNGQRGQALQAYFSCLRDHGVEVPTTVAGGPPASVDRNAPGFAAAQEVCQALLPQRPSGPTTSTTVGA